MSELPSYKLQKILANLGYGSRREIEGWITDGRVKLNGKPAKLGDRATERDVVLLDGNTIALDAVDKTTRVILYNKPVGEICTNKDQPGMDRPTVFDQLPHIPLGKWVSVGRLDINTSGLLLFTNNGDLANKLMHPRTGIEREYLVRVLGDITPDMKKSMRSGIALEDGLAKFEDIVHSKSKRANQWFYVVTMSGRYRLVRRMFEHFEAQVNRLKRVRFGSIFLPKELPEGHWRELTGYDLQTLCLLGKK